MSTANPREFIPFLEAAPSQDMLFGFAVPLPDPFLPDPILPVHTDAF